MSKKIVIDARLYGLEHTGIGKYLVHLIEELKNLDKINRYSILLNNKYFDELKLPKNWEKIKANYPHYTFVEQFGLLKILMRIKPDLVHFPSFNTPIFWRGKFVVTIHDMTMHHQKREASKLSLPVYLFKRIPYKMTFWYAVKRSDKIIVPSNYVKEKVIEYYRVNEEKVEVINEGFDDKSYTNTSIKRIEKYKLDKKFFFYVGALYPHKNLARVIEAISLLKKEKGKEYQLVIASSRGYFTKRLEVLAEELGVSRNIKFVGFVPNEDLGSLYKYSSSLIYPSLSEGFGLQGLEAMASRTLVLASSIPVFEEVYKDNAIYFDPNDKVAIAEKMEGIIKMNPHVRTKKIRESQKFIERYSWQKMAKETLEVYNSVI